MNDLVEGGYEPQAGRPHAFIYQISTGQFTPLTVMTDKNIAETAYGVWHNGGTSYTIVGGYTEVSDIERAYILDYDSSTGIITIVSQKYCPSTVLMCMCLSGFIIFIPPSLSTIRSGMSCPLLPESKIICMTI
jgi:hypothetical protein